MNLYTKCSKCEEELSVLLPSNTVDDGVVVNEQVFCRKCWEKESKAVIESKQRVLNKIGLGSKHQYTKIENNVLYLVTDIGSINKEYYGVDEYSLVINTMTNDMSICRDGEVHLNLDKQTSVGTLTDIINVMKFMCD